MTAYTTSKKTEITITDYKFHCTWDKKVNCKHWDTYNVLYTYLPAYFISYSEDKTTHQLR